LYRYNKGPTTIQGVPNRSPLEYANSVWNPYRMGLIKDLEKVQMTATNLVMKLKHLKYKERL